MLKGLLTQRNKISQNDLDSVASASLTTKCVSWESETCGWWLVEEAWTHNHTHWEEAWTHWEAWAHTHVLKRSLNSQSLILKPELTLILRRTLNSQSLTPKPELTLTHTEKPEFIIPHTETWAHTHWKEPWTHSHSQWTLCSHSYAENSELTLTHTEEPEFTPTHRDY